MASATIARRGEPAAEPRRAGASARAPAPRPRVCFVAPHAWPVLSADPGIPEIGGAEVQQCVLARLLAADGFRVSMICLDYGQREPSLIDGITVYRAYRLRAGVPVLRFLHPRLTALWSALGRAGADVYYSRSAGMLAGVVAEFCRRRGRRSIYAAASDADFLPGGGDQIRYARDRWLYRRGVVLADCVVAQNELQRERCRALYGREALVIPSCYTLPDERAASRPGDTVLWVGVMRAGKRPEIFLELARRLPQRRFVMVGGPAQNEAALYERVRAQAAALDNLEFVGFLPLGEVEARFDAARLLVNTSDTEGLPNTFLQAWARGVPTLATVAAENPAHRFFPDADAGAREIEALFARPELWQRASALSREHFERNHSGAETLARYARLLEELAA
jgi:glycosyltransferase involved in cell wall biosynthesis